MQQSRPNISIPTPGNWHGVTDGLTAARKAIQMDRFEQAESILVELLEFSPVEVKAWKLLARVQRHLGHIEEGIDSATLALQLQNNPLGNEPVISVTLARLLWEQKEYGEARTMLEQLMDEQSDNSSLIELQQRWSMEKIA